MRRNILAAIAAMGVAAFGAGAAEAQVDADATDENAPMYCVYNALTVEFDYMRVAEAFLLADASQEEIDKGVALVAKAADACAATHKLTEDQKAAAADIGLYGSAADYLTDELEFDDVTEEAIDGIYAILGDMSDDDLDKLAEADWRDDAAFSGKLKAALVAKGIPEDDISIDISFQVIELASMAMDRVMSFMLGELDKKS